MRAMERQVPLEWQMEVDRAGQKRKHAQREAHKETEKIEIGPGHKSPRARHLLCATSRCGARAEIRVTNPVDGSGHRGPVLLNCGVVRQVADGRCPSVVLHSDDCPDARLLRDARPSRASGEFPPVAKSPDANLHVPRWSGVR